MSETINISTKKLKNAIQISSFTTSKEKENILSNTLIKTENSKIVILSKNSTTKSKQTIDIEGTIQTNKILINPNILFNILKELKDDKTQITFEEKTMLLKNQNFKTTIKTLNQELYPEEVETQKEYLGVIEFDKLKHLMKSTIAYPDKNDIAREYTGIFIEITKDKMKATSTDHFRLINVTTNIENKDKIEEKFIIENDGASLITKIDMEKITEIYKNSNSIELKDSEKSIESKIIKGEFPDYEALLFNNNDNYVVLDRDNLLSSTRRVSVTNTEDEIELKIEPDEKLIKISSKNQEGEESIDQFDIKDINNDNALLIKLNSKFLMGFLSQVDTESVNLYYRSSEEPIMLKTEDKTFVYNYIMTPITQ